MSFRSKNALSAIIFAMSFVINGQCLLWSCPTMPRQASVCVLKTPIGKMSTHVHSPCSNQKVLHFNVINLSPKTTGHSWQVLRFYSILKSLQNRISEKHSLFILNISTWVFGTCPNVPYRNSMGKKLSSHLMYQVWTIRGHPTRTNKDSDQTGTKPGLRATKANQDWDPSRASQDLGLSQENPGLGLSTTISYLWKVSDSNAMKRFSMSTADKASQVPTSIWDMM